MVLMLLPLFCRKVNFHMSFPNDGANLHSGIEKVRTGMMIPLTPVDDGDGLSTGGFQFMDIKFAQFPNMM